MEIGLDIKNFSPAKKRLLLLLGLLAIVVLFVVYFVQPYLGKIEQLSAEIEKQTTEIRIAEREVAELPELITKNQRLMARLFELQLHLPDEKEVSELLKQVSELATVAGLRIILWQPKGKAIDAKGEVYEIPVKVEVYGAYHRFGQFLSGITKLDRIVNIVDMDMKAVELEGVHKINIGFTAMTYSPLPEAKREELRRAALEKLEKEEGR